MYDDFTNIVNIFKANNIKFEVHSWKKESGLYCKEIKLDGGTFFFDEYDEFTKAVYYH